MANFKVVNVLNKYLQLQDQDTGYWLGDPSRNLGQLIEQQDQAFQIAWSVVNESRLNNRTNLATLNSLILTVR